MRISDQGIALIKRFEGCELRAYQDAVGVWTIGYGWTGAVNGAPITAGMTITKHQAEQLLSRGLERFEHGVARSLRVSVTQGQFDALVSFAYNVGVGAVKTSTLMKRLNVGDTRGAADEFLRWNKAGGVILGGLIKRREAERALFLS